MDEINSIEQELLCIKKKKLEKFYKMYLLTVKVNQKKLTKPIYSVQYCPKPIRKNSKYEYLP